MNRLILIPFLTLATLLAGGRPDNLVNPEVLA